ncbi:hypothetical protein BJF82_11695 [Kytococcus sp. CUA-901]|nr:hypothetical protein BJF82_11695 [Kytococcus sp. CUA-901]
MGRTALALAIDHALAAGLHRVEVAVAVHNEASLAMVAALGLREEGVRVGATFIDGQWCDHRVFAVTAPEWDATRAVWAIVIECSPGRRLRGCVLR